MCVITVFSSGVSAEGQPNHFDQLLDREQQRMAANGHCIGRRAAFSVSALIPSSTALAEKLAVAEKHIR